MALFQLLGENQFHEFLRWPWPLNGNHRVIFIRGEDTNKIRCIGDFTNKLYVSYWPTKVEPRIYFKKVLPDPVANETDSSICDNIAEELPGPLHDLSTNGGKSNETLHEVKAHPGDTTPASPSKDFDPEQVKHPCAYSYECPYGQFCVNFHNIVPGAPNYCFRADKDAPPIRKSS